MSREIKFRVWDAYNEAMIYSSEENAYFILQNGEWNVKFIREKNMVVEGIEVDAPVWHESSDEIELMQYTGLKDATGKEVYEGDVITFCEYDFKNNANWIIGFKGRGYIGVPMKSNLNVYQDEQHCNNYLQFKVIGNIHQNAEVLK